jgi:hypothetical protein
MQFSPFSRYLIPLRSKYPPQHPVFKHPQSMFLPSTIIKMRVSWKVTPCCLVNGYRLLEGTRIKYLQQKTLIYGLEIAHNWIIFLLNRLFQHTNTSSRHCTQYETSFTPTFPRTYFFKRWNYPCNYLTKHYAIKMYGRV